MKDSSIYGRVSSFLAWRALRSAGGVALVTTALVTIASIVRSLPLLLDDAVALPTVLAFARILTVPGSQTVFLVAVPTGLSLLAVDLVARGETRALAAVGVSPWRMTAATWPAIALLAIVPVWCSVSYGDSARSPGRLVTAMLGSASEACGPTMPISRVPWVGVVALCEGPTKVLALSTEAALLRARGVTFALDLSAATLADARVDLRGPPQVVLRTPSLTVRGAGPFALPLGVHHHVRSGAIVVAAALGGFTSFFVLTLRRESRLRAAFLVSGAVPALATVAFLDARSPEAASIWSALPLSAVLPAAIFWAYGVVEWGVPAVSRED